MNATGSHSDRTRSKGFVQQGSTTDLSQNALKLNDVTIVIPTYNRRHHYVRRILDYLCAQNKLGSVIVVDSSQDPFPESGSYDATYLHYPECGYNKKLDAAFERVSTRYALICADDDFVIPAGVRSCVDFLDNNPDYSSAQGNSVCFTAGRYPIDFPWMAENYDLDVHGADVISRLNTWRNRYFYLHYSVHRTKSLQDTFSLAAKFDDDRFAVLMGEKLLNLVCLIHGDHRILPVFYQAREYASSSSTRESFRLHGDGYLVQPPGREYLEELISDVALFLGAKSQISTENARKLVAEWLSPRPPLELSPRGNSLVKWLKVGYSELYWRVYKQRWCVIAREFKRKRYIRNHLEGFPYSDDAARNDWLNVRRVINDHNV